MMIGLYKFTIRIKNLRYDCYFKKKYQNIRTDVMYHFYIDYINRICVYNK